jgi:hypothetical protein
VGYDVIGLWQLASKVEQALWVAAGSSITADYRQRYRYAALALRTHPALRNGLLQVEIQNPPPPSPPPPSTRHLLAGQHFLHAD